MRGCRINIKATTEGTYIIAVHLGNGREVAGRHPHRQTGAETAKVTPSSAATEEWTLFDADSALLHFRWVRFAQSGESLPGEF